MPDASGERADLPESRPWSRALLRDPDLLFGRNYNRQHFQFEHRLTGNPLFCLDSLIELAARMPNHDDTYWSTGKVGVGDGWESGRPGRRSLADTIAGIADNDSLVILKHAEQDALYGPVLKDVLAGAITASGAAMQSDVIVGEVLILISSPHRVTPYHIDAETNFLLQVEGDKTIWVFDPADRTLVTHAERERYFAGDFNSAPCREDRLGDGTEYDLRAGTGVHIPVFAPHWVQNHGNVSVALSVNYELRSVARMARIYGMNARLRRVGLEPTPPGVSPWRDGLKMRAGSALEAARRALGRAPRRPTSPYPVWTPADT